MGTKASLIARTLGLTITVLGLIALLSPVEIAISADELDLEGVVAEASRDVDVPRPVHGHAFGFVERVPTAITRGVDDFGHRA